MHDSTDVNSDTGQADSLKFKMTTLAVWFIQIVNLSSKSVLARPTLTQTFFQLWITEAGIKAPFRCILIVY